MVYFSDIFNLDESILEEYGAMNIGCYSADEKTKEWDKVDGRNVEYTRRHSDSIIVFIFLHSGFEIGVLNIQFVTEFTD